MQARAWKVAAMIWSFYRHIRFEVSVLPKKTIVSLVFTMIGMSKFCAKWRYVSFRPKKQKNKYSIPFLEKERKSKFHGDTTSTWYWKCSLFFYSALRYTSLWNYRSSGQSNGDSFLFINMTISWKFPLLVLAGCWLRLDKTSIYTLK